MKSSNARDVLKEMVSTTAVMETQFAEQFREIIKTETDPVLKKLRQEAFAVFSLSGFPATKNEDWKYTSVGPIAKEAWTAVPFSPDFSLSGEKSGEKLAMFNFHRNGFTSLNIAFADFTVVRIPKETSIAEPIEFHFATDENNAIFPHILVIAEAGSKATIVESYASTAKSFTNAAIQIVVEDNANLTHYRVQKDSPEAFNVGTTEVTLGRGSRYDSTNINLGRFDLTSRYRRKIYSRGRRGIR